MTFPGLCVAVLGPGLGSPLTPGSMKRQQIRSELEADGHHPFFPEDEGLLVPEYPNEPILEQERRLLVRPDVDLIVVLCTAESVGAGYEVANFMSVPEIKTKTAILFPRQLYTPDESVPANTVRAYHVKLPYADEHFRSCQLVAECRKWAEDKQASKWPGIIPFAL